MNDGLRTNLVFHALANEDRRRMMDIIRQQPGCSVGALCRHFATSRIAVMKHLKVLVAARIVLSTKKGRTRELFFNAAPIQMIYDRWTTEYSAFWVTQAVDLKYKVETKRGAAGRRTTAGKGQSKPKSISKNS